MHYSLKRFLKRNSKIGQNSELSIRVNILWKYFHKLDQVWCFERTTFNFSWICISIEIDLSVGGRIMRCTKHSQLRPERKRGRSFLEKQHQIIIWNRKKVAYWFHHSNRFFNSKIRFFKKKVMFSEINLASMEKVCGPHGGLLKINLIWSHSMSES